MIANEGIVLVVDDDHRIRAAMSDLLAAADMQVRTFASAAEYLAFPRPDVPTCVVLDIELPDLNGLALQDRLAREDHPPIVFVTAHGDIPSSVRAMKAGAVDFLPKPFREDSLLSAVNEALTRDRTRRSEQDELAELRRRYATLSSREREVLPLIVRGLLNKQSAARLGISENTLQIHRRRIVDKMGATSLADLVRIAMRLGDADAPRGSGDGRATTDTAG